MKQAQIELQFRWIFVIIVGIVFLLFFFGMITSQSDASEQQISASLARNFETILATTGQRDDTLKEYTVPPTQLNFICNSTDDVYEYRLGNVRASDTKFDTIFSPATLQSRRLYTWTQQWEAPFPVSTFLYVTNDDHLYIFQESSDFKQQQLTSSFPSNLSVFIESPTNKASASLNYAGYTHIFLKHLLPSGTSPAVVPGSTVVVIDDTTCGKDLFDCGDVYIMPASAFTYGGPGVNSFTQVFNSEVGKFTEYRTAYLGKASLYGAVFSPSKDRYACEMDKAYARLRNLAQLEKYRLESMFDDVTSICARNLGMDEAFPGPKQYLEAIVRGAENGFDPTTVDDLYTRVSNLKQRNDALAILGNCPSIY